MRRCIATSCSRHPSLIAAWRVSGSHTIVTTIEVSADCNLDSHPALLERLGARTTSSHWMRHNHCCLSRISCVSHLMKSTSLLTVPLLFSSTWLATADVIKFDELTSWPYVVPSSYAGWAWTDTASLPWGVGHSASTPSVPVYVYNLGVDMQGLGRQWVGMSHGSISVDVAGAYFASLGTEHLRVEAYSAGSLVASETLGLSAAFAWYDLNFQNVDYLRFYTDAPDHKWAMDNFTYSIHVADSGSTVGLSLLTSSAFGLVCILRRWCSSVGPQ